MELLEKEAVLKSFRIIVDTREHMTPRAAARFEAFGVPCEKGTLNYGDYTYNADLPDGKTIVQADGPISARCVVERKMSLDELAGNLGRGRDRFRREFERAQEAGARVFLVVEGGNWDKISNGIYRSRFNSKAYFNTLAAWCARYDLNLHFCSAMLSGKLIKELLYRDLKARLERGEYD